MASLKEIVIMYQSLKREWDKKPPNLDRCGDFLTKLKIALTGVTFLPTDESSPSKQELLVARDILEIGAQWAIVKRDIPVFERYMAQLKCYYMDYKYVLRFHVKHMDWLFQYPLLYLHQLISMCPDALQIVDADNLPESTYKYQLLGLNLLCLLAQNRLAEFHTELELLPVKELQNNIYIKHPVSMEQYLMEGSYNKVFLAKGNVPAENYNFFIDILLDTIRNEIASCIEKAYEKIALNEAARMLFFENAKPMKDYAVQRGWTLPPDGFFHFQCEKKDTDEVIPAKMLAEQTIEYARELEMIV